MIAATPALVAAANGGRYVCWMSVSVTLKEWLRRACPSVPMDSRWYARKCFALAMVFKYVELPKAPSSSHCTARTKA
jgi:hypothetical protein